MTGVDSAKCLTCRRCVRHHGELFCKRCEFGCCATTVPVNQVSLGWCAVHYELVGYTQKRLQQDEEPQQTLRAEKTDRRCVAVESVDPKGCVTRYASLNKAQLVTGVRTERIRMAAERGGQASGYLWRFVTE